MYEYVNISQTWPVTSAPGSVFMQIFRLFVLFGTELVNVKKLRSIKRLLITKNIIPHLSS